MPSLPATNPKAGLLITTAAQLIPLFTRPGMDGKLAYEMAVSAIDAYHPQSRADFVNIARTIAFSMAALALLGHATTQDITMAAKMRAYGRANTLNRSADQSERTMMQRRRQQNTAPLDEEVSPADQPPLVDSASDDPPQSQEVVEQEIDAAVAEAMREFADARANAATASAQPEPPADPSSPQTAPMRAASARAPISSPRAAQLPQDAAIPQAAPTPQATPMPQAIPVLQAVGSNPAAILGYGQPQGAIHYNPARPPVSPSFKAALLGQAAMPQPAEQLIANYKVNPAAAPQPLNQATPAA